MCSFSAYRNCRAAHENIFIFISITHPNKLIRAHHTSNNGGVAYLIISMEDSINTENVDRN